jgi:hypothetical protein
MVGTLLQNLFSVVLWVVNCLSFVLVNKKEQTK